MKNDAELSSKLASLKPKKESSCREETTIYEQTGVMADNPSLQSVFVKFPCGVLCGSAASLEDEYELSQIKNDLTKSFASLTVKSKTDVFDEIETLRFR